MASPSAWGEESLPRENRSQLNFPLAVADVRGERDGPLSQGGGRRSLGARSTGADGRQ
jgi:hypothetical protein